MKVIFNADHQAHNAGDVIEAQHCYVRHLLAKGICSMVTNADISNNIPANDVENKPKKGKKK